MKKAKRICSECGCSVNGLFNQCQRCREKNCSHTETHFDSAHNHICACGRVIAKRRLSPLLDKTVEKIRGLSSKGVIDRIIATKLRVKIYSVRAILSGRTHRIDRINKGSKRSSFVPTDWANSKL